MGGPRNSDGQVTTVTVEFRHADGVTTEGPGLVVFAFEDGAVYHTYSVYVPESNFLVFSNQILEQAPKGAPTTGSLAADDFTEQTTVMASYSVNKRAVARARRLIAGRQYVLNSVWGDVQPRAETENTFLESHAWDEYGEWHLGLTEDASEETKARYAFVYGDFHRIHRSGLLACQYRAAEWRHTDIELAAHELLQLLDKKRA